MGPRTLFSLLFCQLLFLASGDPIEAGEKNLTAAEPEDFSYLHAEYNLLKDKLCNKMWKSHGFYCYRYFDTPKSFNEAEDECHSYGRDAHLTSIYSHHDSVFLADLVEEAESDVWVGLRNLEDCDSWTWTDGTPYNPEYTPWGAGQPDLCVVHPVCVQLMRSSKFYKWNDVDCSNRTGYICETPAKH
ncbi:C-type lectin mannose-binding isoform-like [Heteronotia binoei]|uniref:C-type lectin mannose-binding isoform-like n=1 Tax=Heteronotia binoei TaxID=13085 RepID=UPI00292DAFF3|nr:C-type lectin mannose-binding isoform-like [Heteronotia binoei]